MTCGGSALALLSQTCILRKQLRQVWAVRLHDRIPEAPWVNALPSFQDSYQPCHLAVVPDGRAGFHWRKECEAENPVQNKKADATLPIDDTAAAIAAAGGGRDMQVEKQ